MSDRVNSVWRASVAIATAIVLASTAAAQETATLRKIVDSLEHEYRQADSLYRSLRSGDSARLAQLQLGDGARVRFVAEGQVVVADSSLLRLAQVAATDAARYLRLVFGSAADVGEWVLLHAAEGPPAEQDGPVSIMLGYREQSGRLIANNFTSTALRTDAQRATSAWVQKISQRMLDSMGIAREWLAQAVPASLEGAREPLGTYMSLVLSADPLWKGCISGVVASCRAALDVDGTNADVRSHLPAGARMALFIAAIDVGGEGAYSRFLIGDDKTIAERLEAASGIPADSLLRIWLQRVEAAHASRAQAEARTIISALAWCCLLCVVSLWSSRWR